MSKPTIQTASSQVAAPEPVQGLPRRSRPRRETLPLNLALAGMRSFTTPGVEDETGSLAPADPGPPYVHDRYSPADPESAQKADDEGRAPAGSAPSLSAQASEFETTQVGSPGADSVFQKLSSAFATAGVEGELEEVFSSLAEGHLPPGLVGDAPIDDEAANAANAELFRQMAYNHSRPLREFMLDLSMGPATKQWIEVVQPVVDNLRKAAEALGQQSFAAALGTFDTTLTVARESQGTRLAGRDRHALLSAYDALSGELPNVFDFKDERALREPLLVDHLLRQVPGVFKTTIDKLYAAGLGSLEALCRSTTEDLVALGRLDADRADAIVERFRDYRHEKAAHANGLEQAQEKAKAKLFNLLNRLVEAHDAFRTAEANDDREGKRIARSERQAITLDITILLVQLGEVDLVEAVERSPTERKVEQVRKFVAESQGVEEPVRRKMQ